MMGFTLRMQILHSNLVASTGLAAQEQPHLFESLDSGGKRHGASYMPLPVP